MHLLARVPASKGPTMQHDPRICLHVEPGVARITPSPATAAAERAACLWEGLAALEERRLGWDRRITAIEVHARAEGYRRHAEALRREARTGQPHCPCCLQPMRAEP